MKKVILVLLLAAFVLTAFGCSKDVEGTVIGVRGQITGLNMGQDSKTMFILVEGKLEQDTAYDKASLTITDKTKIIDKGTDKKLSKEALKEGMQVEVIMEGSVRESYPVQGDAKEVRIIK